MTASLDRIPTIDIAPFLSGDEDGRARVVEAVAQACEEIGFLVITGHGLPGPVLDQAIERCLAFFDLPEDEKLQWRPTGPAKQRGYQAIRTRSLAHTLGEDAPLDLRETIFMGPVDDHRDHFASIPEAATMYAPNILPDTPEGTDTALVDLYRAYERVASGVMRLLAAALDQPEDYFAPMMGHHFAVLGAHHYPALASPPEPGQLRAGAHTDFGAVTILAMTDGRGGLEARTPDGRWLPVQAPKGSLVVNLGDMMARWTNDRWVSTLHRVATPEVGDDGSRRLSMAFFVHPDFDAEIRCIPSCLSPGETPKFETITAGEHIRRKIQRSIAA